MSYVCKLEDEQTLNIYKSSNGSFVCTARPFPPESKIASFEVSGDVLHLTQTDGRVLDISLINGSIIRAY
jgi:hypothetical protein